MARNRRAERAGAQAPKRGAVQRAGEALDLPAELLPGYAHIELLSNRRAIVTGVKGVLAYCEDAVRLNLGALVVAVEGCDLCIRTYQMEEVTLSGTILSVNFTS
ncbi:MAG: YabP/YqfC family sporulation protein [Oscillospiraceae bacterium]|jgi:sporulation protein YqfC|nr:YabP/YqfC family sporulation protein [Oscillospiraceae bacterium]